MDPLKAVAAAVFCLALFVLVLRLTRRLMDAAIAAGRVEERRAAETEDGADRAREPDHPAGAVP